MKIIRSLFATALVTSLTGCMGAFNAAPPEMHFPEAGDKPVDAAFRLVLDQLDDYEGRAREAANGPRLFELPALAALATGTIGAAVGHGAQFAFISGATAAIFGAGQAYFAPRTRAIAYRDAMNASSCILTEMAGLDNFVEDGDAQPAGVGPGLNAVAKKDPSIAVSVSLQYYTIVQAASLRVHNTLADRLLNAGQTDPTALLSNLKEINQEQNEAEAMLDVQDDGMSMAEHMAMDKLNVAPVGVTTKDKDGNDIEVMRTAADGSEYQEMKAPQSDKAAVDQLASALVELEKLKPALKTCTLLANG